MIKGWRTKWRPHIVLSGHTSHVKALAISGDGTRIASGSLDETLRLWDADTGASLCDPIQQSSKVRDVVFFPNGSHIACGLEDGQLAVWDVATREMLGPTLQGHTKSINRLSLSSDGLRLVSASSDHTLRLRNMGDTSAAPVVIEGHSSAVNSASFSPDGTLIASGSDDYTVRLWDGATGTSAGLPLQHDHIVVCVTFSPSGDAIASGSGDSRIYLWSVERKSLICSFRGHSDYVRCVSFLPDGNKIVSGSDDNTVRLWDVASRNCISQLSAHTGWVWCIAFLPEGNRVVSGSEDHTIRIWDLDVPQGEEETPKDHKDRIGGVAFSPRGSKIATCSKEGTLKVWSTLNGDLSGEMKGHTKEVNCLAFSPDGSTIASGSDDRSLRLWDVETMKCLKVLEDHGDWIRCVVFSHDGSKIISGEKIMRLWDSMTGVGVRVGESFSRISGDLYYIAFSPDDTKIISGYSSGSLQLWSITGERLCGFSHNSGIRFITFSTDNLYILSACDKEISIWSISSSDYIARFSDFLSSPTKLLPPHIQDIRFDITTTSDSWFQASAVFNSLQRYFNDPHFIHACLHQNNTITLSKSSNYLFHLPADVSSYKWKGNGGIMVIGGSDGRVTILDFSHLPL